MAEIKAEYKDPDGFYIVRISDNKYYYGDGKTLNAFGISANQSLRFHPYMEYIGDRNEPASDDVAAWIAKNRK